MIDTQLGLMPVIIPDYITDAFGYWMSGLTDGEGNFQMRAHTRTRSDGYTGREIEVRFKIKLRDDDRHVLQYIQQTLRCGAMIDSNYFNSDGMNRKPQCALYFQNNGELETVIVPLFRRYPLHTKKAREFELWAEAVNIRSASIRYKRQKGRIRNRPFLTDGQWNRLVFIQNEIRNNIRKYQGRSGIE